MVLALQRVDLLVEFGLDLGRLDDHPHVHELKGGSFKTPFSQFPSACETDANWKPFNTVFYTDNLTPLTTLLSFTDYSSLACSLVEDAHRPVPAGDLVLLAQLSAQRLDLLLGLLVK